MKVYNAVTSTQINQVVLCLYSCFGDTHEDKLTSNQNVFLRSYVCYVGDLF